MHTHVHALLPRLLSRKLLQHAGRFGDCRGRLLQRRLVRLRSATLVLYKPLLQQRKLGSELLLLRDVRVHKGPFLFDFEEHFPLLLRLLLLLHLLLPLLHLVLLKHKFILSFLLTPLLGQQ